jgi:hypothetical protein
MLNYKRLFLGVAIISILSIWSMCVNAERTAMVHKVVTLEGVVGSDTYNRAGLNKLTEAEQTILKQWIEVYVHSIANSIEEDCLAGRIKPRDK